MKISGSASFIEGSKGFLQQKFEIPLQQPPAGIGSVIWKVMAYLETKILLFF